MSMAATEASFCYIEGSIHFGGCLPSATTALLKDIIVVRVCDRRWVERQRYETCTWAECYSQVFNNSQCVGVVCELNILQNLATVILLHCVIGALHFVSGPLPFKSEASTWCCHFHEARRSCELPQEAGGEWATSVLTFLHSLLLTITCELSWDHVVHLRYSVRQLHVYAPCVD